MNGLIITSIIVYICSYVTYGFNLATVLGFISTALFCGRKVGYFSKMKSHLSLEIIGTFVTVITQLLLSRFNLLETIIYILLRCVFLCVVQYDNTVYVYITEEVSHGREER